MACTRIFTRLILISMRSVYSLRPFLNTLIKPGIIRSGTKLSLLTETLTTTLVELGGYPHKTLP